MRFYNEGKFSTLSMGHYELKKWVAKFPYELKLPSELASVHPKFHVSMHKKCIGDPYQLSQLKD